LKTTGEHRDGYRDHVIISLALGTGLREHELLALDCGDVFDEDGRTRRRVSLRVFKRSAEEPAIQEVVLPDLVRAKLDKLRAWKKGKGESCRTKVTTGQETARREGRSPPRSVRRWRPSRKRRRAR
jgi:integrase